MGKNQDHAQFIVGACLAVAIGCAAGDGRRPRIGRDASTTDAGMMVDAATDTGFADTGFVDTGFVDAGFMDAGAMDTGSVDAGSVDAGASDAGFDAGPPDAGPPDSGPPDAGLPPACTGALAATRNGFESEADGWLTGNLDGQTGSWPFNPWEWGTPRSGQPACAEGTTCLGTDLDDNYAQCGRAFIESPAFDVSACGSAPLVLVLTHHYRFWTGAFGGTTWTDGGLLEVSIDDGRSWLPFDPSGYPGTVRINPNRGSSYACLDADSFYVDGRPGFVGSNAGWEDLVLPLPSVAWGAPSVTIRFLFSSGVSSSTTSADTSRLATEFGWFFDDVRIEAM
ncbi:MAG: hypothetical protein AAGE52_41135 [Myxococcota bacterium]